VKYDRMRCLPEDKRKVACFLGTFSSGVTDDYGTPLLGKSYRQPGYDKDRARKWLGDKLEEYCNLSSLPEWLAKAEAKCRSKHGTLSRRPPWDVTQHVVGDSLKTQVEAVRTRHPVVLNERAANIASDFVRSLYSVTRKGYLKPTSMVKAAISLPTNTGLGYPKFVTGKAFLRAYLAEALYLESLGFPLGMALDYLGLIGARSVSFGPYTYSKTRYITQWSRVLGIVERTVFTPISTELKQLPIFCALVGPVRVNEVITRMLRGASNPFLSLDFTGFDASVPFEVIDRVFSVMASWFSGSEAPRFAFILKAFKEAGLIVPGGIIRDRRRGIPSGSVLTNLVDSLVNLWVMKYAATINGGTVCSALVQGDDGVYSFKGLPSYSVLSDTLSSELGMTITMSEDKNLISSRRVIYLQNYHSLDYDVGGLIPGIRPIYRASCNMMGHERAPAQKDEWLAKYNTYRYLQQANNAFDHPRFKELCVWLWTFDGYIREALGKIIRDDSEVYRANELLNVGSGERGKLPVADLRWSPVVSTLLAEARRRNVSL